MRDNHKQTYINCGKFMRAVDKCLRVNTFWKPVGLSELFEEAAQMVDESDANQSDMDQDDPEDKTQCHTTAKTSKITSWNYDLPYDDSNNPLQKALCFARLADVMSKED